MDRKRRLMENNNGWPLRNQLFDGAPIALPLTHTVIGRGGLTPSFTRATTETGQKYDEAGYLDFTALAGEMVFKGARREYNQWTTSSVSLANGANKSLTLAAGTYQFSMGAGTGTATFSGTGGATGTLAASTDRVSVAKTITAGTFVVTASVADLADLQVCNITGETDQTTIRPYVSVGVESAPAYHGSMVDGVKCFDTDRSGNPISTSGSYPIVGYVPWESRTNVMTYSNLPTSWAALTGTPPVQNAIGPNGQANYAWTGTDDQAAQVERVTNSRTLTAATYTSQAKFKKTTGAQSSYPVYYESSASSKIALCTVDTTNGIATVWTAYTGLTVTASSARCVSFNNDYWLVTLTFLADATTWFGSWAYAGATNATKATGIMDDAAQGSSVACDFGCELGAFATPYIPTTTVAVARNASVLTYTGADVANIKTLAATFSRGVGVSNVGVVASLSDGTSANYISPYLTNATVATWDVNTASSLQVRTNASNAYVPGDTSKMSISFALNSVLMDKDGVSQTPDTTATIPTTTQLNVGHLAGTLVFNGPVNHIYGFTRNLSQSELGAVDA